MPRSKELAEALEIIEAPVEAETRCGRCRFRNNSTLWSCAYIDIVGVSKRLAFPHALPQELCETEGYPCIAFQEGAKTTGATYSQVLSWRRQKGLPGNTKHGRPKKR